MEKKKHYIVYQITNKLNDNIYIGAHMTENINDKYFGSGNNIKKAIKEFGKDNFEKIILHNFDTKEEMLEKERELVNDEFIKRGDTYNIILGGGNLKTENLVTVKDKNGFTFDVHKTDPRYLSGEVVSIMVGKIIVKNKGCNKYYMINKIDYDKNKHETNKTNKIIVKDKDNNKFTVSVNDPRYISGELVGHTKDTAPVKNKQGDILLVSVDDPRYISGELVHIWQGKKHSPETRLKMSENRKGKYTGKNNSSYGSCWIHNLDLKESKKIKKEDISQWIDKGWLKGRKMKF